MDVLKHDSEVLARIQDGFHAIVKEHSTAETPPIEVTCFYEELPVLGVGFSKSGKAKAELQLLISKQ